MRIYIIGNDGITLCREAPATVNEGEIAVASNEDLHTACIEALRIPRQACVAFAAGHTWQASARVFVDHALNVRRLGSPGEMAEFVAQGPHFAA